MRWLVKLTKGAKEDLDCLDKTVRRRIIEKLDWLGENFDEITPLSLSGEFKDFYKLRVGDWRLFYQVDWEKNVIFVVYIDHRSSAYK